MKKVAWTIGIGLFAVTLGGCALPEKTRVSQPEVAPRRPEAPVYYPQDGGDQQPAPQISLEPGEQRPFGALPGQEVTLPTTGYLNDRIYEYGRKLERWQELDRQAVAMQLKDEEKARMIGCFRNLQNVLNGYSELRSRVLEAQKVDLAAQISSEEIFELQKNDIAFLEGDCGRLIAKPEEQGASPSRRDEGTGLAQLETQIDRYSTGKEYEEVLQTWEKIPESQQSRVQLRTRLHYANALMYLHQEEKAAQAYQRLVDQMAASGEQATDLVSLRKVLADLYTASGNYQAAATEYKKITEEYLNLGQVEEWSKLQLSLLDRSMTGSPELTEYSGLLRNFMGFVPDRDGYKLVWQADTFLDSYPYSPVASNVQLIKQSVEKAADGWFNGIMARADQLSREKKFPEASKLLNSVPEDIIGPDKRLLVKNKGEQLELAEAVESESSKMARMQELQNQWNNGLLLAQDGRYDEALSVFNGLRDGEYSAKAEAKIKELSLEAAKADRKKAADLFIRYTKTDDLESRKRLLIESRRLLKEILAKYPEVEIAPKVAGNIARVEQEMRAIDPNLIVIADQEMTPPNQVQDPDPTSIFDSPPSGDQPPLIEPGLSPPPVRP